MIKDWVARAMQISCLEGVSDIKRLHSTENSRGYVLPPGNLQEVLHLPNIKEIYRIPYQELDAHEKHAARIEQEIKASDLHIPYLANETHLEWTHRFDWMIFDHKALIKWEYDGERRRGRILAQLM